MKLTSLDLRVFAAIVELGGISAAARKLNMQKSSVSRDLAALEERLGTRLIQRTTRRISLTDAGEVLAAFAQRVTEELENAEAAVDALHGEPRGHLVTTVPYAIMRFVLAPRMAEFHARYPHLHVSIDPSIRVLGLFEAGIDVAIRVGELPTSSLVARTLLHTTVILVASPAYIAEHGAPDDPTHLTQHRVIDLSSKASRSAWQLYKQNGEAISVMVEPTLAINEPSIALDLAIQGMGITTLPMLYAAKALRTGALQRVLPDFDRGRRGIHAVYPSRRLLTPKVRAFIDFVEQCLRDTAHQSE